MKINAIGVTPFGKKQKAVKEAALLLAGTGAGIIAATEKDMFVKGISAPSEVIENNTQSKANSIHTAGDNTCDACCDTIFDGCNEGIEWD